MTVQDRAYFQKIGEDHDSTGASDVSRRRVIGGAFGEHGAMAENSHALWTESTRNVMSGLSAWGQASPQSAIFTTTTGSASAREEIAQLVVSTTPGRTEVKVFVDHSGCDFEFELQDSSLSVIDTATTASAGRTQTSVALSCGADTDLRVVVKVRQQGGFSGSLYSLRVEESKPAVAAFAASDFKPLDDDIYAAEMPLSPFLMDRCAKNLQASHGARLRRAGTWWPAQATTGGGEQTRPVLASNTVRGWPLSIWPVGVGVKTVEVRLWCTVADASVSFGLGVYDLYTRRMSVVETTVTQAVTASPVAVTVSADVAQYQGQDVMLVLLVKSADSATSYTQSFAANTYAVQHRAYLKGLTGITFTLFKRYKVGFEENPADAHDSADPRPNERMVIRDSGGFTYVSPLYGATDVGNQSDWSAGAYIVRATEIGQATLYSLEIRETETIDKPSLAGLFRPWLPITAYSIGGLYSEQRKLWMGRTRIVQALPTYDPGRDIGVSGWPSTLWGPVEAFEENGGAFKVMGSALLGNYSHSRSQDGTAGHRMRLRIRGVLAVVGKHDHNNRGERYNTIEGGGVRAQLKATLDDWSGAAWDLNTIASDAINLDLPVVLHSDTETAHLTYGATPQRRAWHALRGACNVRDLTQRRSGWVPFELTITDSQTGAAYRLLRLHVLGNDVDLDGNTITDPDHTAMRLVSWSVVVDSMP